MASSTLTPLLARLVYMSLKCFFVERMTRRARSVHLQARNNSHETNIVNNANSSLISNQKRSVGVCSSF